MISREQLVGNILDQSGLLQKYQEDIEDTISNNNKCLTDIETILSCEGLTLSQTEMRLSEVHFPIRIGYTNAGGVSKYYYLHNGVGNVCAIYELIGATSELNFVRNVLRFTGGSCSIFDNPDLLEIDGIPTIYGLQYSVCDSLGQANMLNSLTDIIRSGREDVLNTFATVNGQGITNATYGTQAMYASITSSLSVAGNGFKNCFEILKSVYNSLANMSSNGNSFSFDTTDYRVQGFAFSNIIGDIVKTTASIVAGIVSVAIPMVGFAAQAVVSLVDRIQNGFNTMNEQSHAIINPDTANSLFNVPIWQGSILAKSMLRNWNEKGSILDRIDETGICTMVTPGVTLYMWRKDASHINVQAYLNLEVSVSTNDMCLGQTFSGYAGTSNITDMTNGCNFITLALSTMGGSYGSRYWYEISVHDNNRSPELTAWNNCFAAINIWLRISSTYLLGSNYSLSNLTQYDDYYKFKQIDDALQRVNSDPSITGDWAFLVNDVIYGLFRNISEEEFFDMFLLPYYLDSNSSGTEMYYVDGVVDGGRHFARFYPADLTMITGNLPVTCDFFVSAPKYSNKATFATIMIAVAAVATTLAVIATTVAVKIKVRNSQIKSYAKVAQAQQELVADPNNTEKLNAYVKAVKSYNFKSGILGYSSRLNMIDGWQEAKSSSDSGSTTISGIYSANSAVKAVNTSVDTVSSNVANVSDDVQLLKSSVGDVGTGITSVAEDMQTVKADIQRLISLIK